MISGTSYLYRPSPERIIRENNKNKQTKTINKPPPPKKLSKMLSLKKAGQIILIIQNTVVRGTVLKCGSYQAIPNNHIKLLFKYMRPLLTNLI